MLDMEKERGQTALFQFYDFVCVCVCVGGGGGGGGIATILLTV